MSAGGLLIERARSFELEDTTVPGCPPSKTRPRVRASCGFMIHKSSGQSRSDVSHLWRRKRGQDRPQPLSRRSSSLVSTSTQEVSRPPTATERFCGAIKSCCASQSPVRRRSPSWAMTTS